MVKAAGYHVREYTMYSQLVPELNNYWKENSTNTTIDRRLNVPEFIYGICNPGEYVVVLQNCKTVAFESNDKRKGLDLDQTMVAVNHIARLHALSHSYNKTVSIIGKYPCLKVSKVISLFFKPLVFAVLENCITFLKSLPDHSDMLKKLEISRCTIPFKFQTLYEDQTLHPILCLIHSDFWNSNLLFRYTESEEHPGGGYLMFQIHLTLFILISIYIE